MVYAARNLVRPGALILGFLTFAGLGVLLGGQISLFIGALILTALRSSDPRLQGIALAAAAAIKPQSLLAAPVALMAARSWKALIWAGAAATAILLLSLFLLGSGVWLRWLIELPRFHAYLVTRNIDRMDVGLYGLAMSLGLPGWVFFAGIPLGIATSWLVFRSEAPTLDRYAAFVVSTVLMSPYTLYYDLAGLTFVCAAYLLDRRRSPLIWTAAAMILSSVLAPVGIILLAVALASDALRRRVAQGAVSCDGIVRTTVAATG